MEQTQKKPRSAVFVAVTFLFWSAMYTYVPTMTPYLNNIGISFSMIGLIGGSYGFSQMLLRVPLGLISDRIGRRKIFIVIGLMIGAASSLGMYLTHNAFLILLFRFMAGVSASVWVIFTVLYSSYFDKDKLASRISYLSMANNFGVMTAKLIGSALAERYGHEISFLLGAAMGLLGLVLSLFITENVPVVTERPTIRSLLGVAKDRNLIAMSTLAVFSQMLLFATTNTFTPEAAVRLGADSMQLGILSTLASVPAILSAMICGKIFAKRVNFRNLVAFSFVLEALGTVMVPLVGSVFMVYVAVIIAGFGFGLCMTTLLSFCTLTVDEGRRSVAMGFYQAIYGLGMFIGPVFIGAFVDFLGLNAGFYISAGVALVALVLTFVLIRRPADLKREKA
jgi:MFS family permease